MKKKILFWFLLCLPAVFHAEVLPFRSGVILAAELSLKAQQIRDLDPFGYPDLPQNRVYAAVTLRLFSGRILSRHDYCLSAFGRDYKCVAIRRGNGPWKSEDSDIAYPAEGEKCSLLFILDSRVVGINPVEKLYLRCNYPPKKYADTLIAFTNLRNQGFTPVSKITEKGALAEQK